MDSSMTKAQRIDVLRDVLLDKRLLEIEIVMRQLKRVMDGFEK